MLRLLLPVLLLAVPAAAADEKFTLKLYQSKTGDKLETEMSEATKGKIVIDVGGMARDQAITSGKKEAYVEEVVEKKAADRKATKLKRTYSVASKTEMGKTTKAVYDDETVVIEKKGDKYEFRIGDKKLSEDEAPELDKSFNKLKDSPANQEFLPAEAVKVGGEWTVPADKTAKMFAALGEEKLKLDAKKSSISGKLLKAYKKDGAQFGVLELTLSVAVTEIDLGGQLVPVKAGGKSVVVMTIDTCIDGTAAGETSKVSATQELVAELPNNGTLTVSSTTTVTETIKVAK